MIKRGLDYSPYMFCSLFLPLAAIVLLQIKCKRGDVHVPSKSVPAVKTMLLCSRRCQECSMTKDSEETIVVLGRIGPARRHFEP